MPKINGIPTKIRFIGEGYWDLVILDPKIAKSLAHEYLQKDPEQTFLDMQLACMHGGKWGRGWMISDRRLFSNRIVRKSVNSILNHEKVFETEIIPPEIWETHKDHLLEGIDCFQTERLEKYVKITWPTFDGLVMTPEHRKMADPEDFEKTLYVHQYRAAMAIMSELKRFWANFKGDSLEEARIAPSFPLQTSARDLYIKVSDLEK